MLGRTISHYRILEKLGEGGMGEVYLAEDTRLERRVALKFLPRGRVGTDSERARFLREARAASALDHPNVGVILDIQETDDGRTYIVMAHYEGETLADRLSRETPSREQAVDIALQMADGLAAAHSRNIVHRDVKPSNVLLTGDGLLKIIDFGLAKDLEATALTLAQGPMGTAAYMSPEQAAGRPVDARADVWALGVVLYEMLSGRRPFRADSDQALLYQVVHESPPPLADLRPDLPRDLIRVVERALAKDTDQRFPSMAALRDALAAHAGEGKGARPRRVWIVAGAGFVALALIAGWLGTMLLPGDDERTRERAELLVRARELIGESRDVEAFRLMEESGFDLQADPALLALYQECSTIAAVRSDPPGARVFYKGYLDVEGDWIPLGTTPLPRARLPQAFLRLRFEKEAHQSREISAVTYFSLVETTLVPEEEAIDGMQLVPGGVSRLGDSGPFEIGSFWLDTHEVTNRQYQEFVDAGGYREEKYWTLPIEQDGRTLEWSEAMDLFLDATGRRGPSTWELGRYPEGTRDHPVGGISWYEANAYLEFAGKQMPTAHHWRHAAGLGIEGDILLLSNFESDGAVAVDSLAGLSPYGNLDMAGNIQEWCWNEVNGLRYSLGGAWTDAPYEFSVTDSKALLPLSRSALLGVRGMKTLEPVPEDLRRSITTPVIDFAEAEPVSDEVFAAILESYDYDRTDLDARVEETTEYEHWTKQKVSFRSSYGPERVPAYLFLPERVEPPYQTVIWFPGAGAETVSSSDQLVNLRYWDFVIKSGRALLYPVYENMYERRQESIERTPNTRRTNIRHWSEDIRRSIDYLQTRPDIDPERIAYYALSLGSTYAPIFLAVEPRFRCSVLLAAGLFTYDWSPDVKPLNFVPRVEVPTLVITGTHDFGLPVETSVKPMVDLLGVDDDDKKLFLYEGDHIPRANEVVKVTLDWLDRYLGEPRRSHPD